MLPGCEDMIEGLSDWMDTKGYTSVDQFVGSAVPNVSDWQYLNLNYIAKARSIRIFASNAAAATSPVRTRPTRRSPTWWTAFASSR